MSSIANSTGTRQQNVPMPVPVYDPTCAWCIKAALAWGLVLPAVESHGICVPHCEQMLSQLKQRTYAGKRKQTMSRIPNVYREFGGPLRWQDDITGVLPEAVHAFFSTPLLTPEQIELVRDYCEYYINAPCWTLQGMEQQFEELRTRVKTLSSVQELITWLHDSSQQVGLDPF